MTFRSLRMTRWNFRIISGTIVRYIQWIYKEDVAVISWQNPKLSFTNSQKVLESWACFQVYHISLRSSHALSFLQWGQTKNDSPPKPLPSITFHARLILALNQIHFDMNHKNKDFVGEKVLKGSPICLRSGDWDSWKPWLETTDRLRRVSRPCPSMCTPREKTLPSHIPVYGFFVYFI